MIDGKGLRLIEKVSDIRIGVAFYKLEDDGTYARCKFHPEEMTDPLYKFWVQQKTIELVKAKKLFVSLNKPWE